jgi:hypothetical protein
MGRLGCKREGLWSLVIKLIALAELIDNETQVWGGFENCF